jgi:hypothetical protein
MRIKAVEAVRAVKYVPLFWRPGCAAVNPRVGVNICASIIGVNYWRQPFGNKKEFSSRH